MDAKREKITRFLNDKGMSNSVYEVIIDQFLKPRKGADVHEKASAFIAIENLQQAWKELERFKDETPQENKITNQVGM